ncbi:MAG TPA: putative porin, partial [Sphingomonas sp.]|nr:putative porin [Sphingomonas sp.]
MNIATIAFALIARSHKGQGQIMKRSIQRAIIACAIAIIPAAKADAAPKVDLSGDVRFRLEQDWDSRTATGAMRDDRARARIRARIGAKIDFGDGFTFEGRLRTAGNNSQQNANVTFADFNGNPTDKLYIVPDRFVLSWRGHGATIEAGRMAFPFFTQNEYFWDGDISPLGAAVNLATRRDGASLGLNAGVFTLPVGANHYSGKLLA